MHLKRLLLRNFRNYAQKEITFSPQVNLIQGKNGQGKTNLLEAIYLISTGRSFRTHVLADLILFGQRFFYLEAEFERQGISQMLSIYYDAQGRKVQHEGQTYSTLHSLLGVLPSVLIAPDDLSLITGSPAERRRFLDLHMAQTDPAYLYHLGRYFRAMKQRNHQLKSSLHEAISAWELAMAQSAQEIILKRKQATQQLSARLKTWVDRLSEQQDSAELHYHTSPSALIEEENICAFLQTSLATLRPKEKEQGHTLVGPHRDDLSIQLSHKSAKHFSSEGQKRGCVAAIRFAQWEQMASTLDDKPLLSIDDFGVQLDERRLSQLKSHLTAFQQIFLTSPLFAQEDLRCFSSFRQFEVDRGEIVST